MLRFALLLLTAGILCAGCGPQASTDLGKLPPVMTSWPRILNVRYLGQSPVANHIILFEVDFDDQDGDLDEGTIDVRINGKSIDKSGLPLKPFLQQGENPLHAREGSFVVAVQLVLANPKEGIVSRSSFEVAMQLSDAEGHKSNYVTVRLLVEPPA